MTEETRWKVLETAEDVAQYTVQQILLQAQKAISSNGKFKLVLSGGTTPERIYALLSEQQQDWSKWFLFVGDERCLAVDDPQRNSQMIHRLWLDKIDFPRENFYPIMAQQGPAQGAQHYAEIIRPFLPFDLILLGIGEDGHTASLFPGHKHNENELVHAVYNSPKAPAERVSLSTKAFKESERLLILVTGRGKKTAVKRWKNGDLLPVAQISSINAVEVISDKDAQP